MSAQRRRMCAKDASTPTRMTIKQLRIPGSSVTTVGGGSTSPVWVSWSRQQKRSTGTAGSVKCELHLTYL